MTTNTNRYQVRAQVSTCNESIEATYASFADAKAHADRIRGKSCHRAWVVEVVS